MSKAWTIGLRELASEYDYVNFPSAMPSGSEYQFEFEGEQTETGRPSTDTRMTMSRPVAGGGTRLSTKSVAESQKRGML